MSTENDIHKASNKFYEALNHTLNGDARQMVDFHDAHERREASRLG
jgi:hypothetical protein